MLDCRNSIKKKAPQALTPPPQPAGAPMASLSSTPISPKSNSPRPPAIKRGNDLNSSSEKVVTTGITSTTRAKILERKKSKSFKATGVGVTDINGGADFINVAFVLLLLRLR